MRLSPKEGVRNPFERKPAISENPLPLVRKTPMAKSRVPLPGACRINRAGRGLGVRAWKEEKPFSRKHGDSRGRPRKGGGRWVGQKPRAASGRGKAGGAQARYFSGEGGEVSQRGGQKHRRAA